MSLHYIILQADVSDMWIWQLHVSSKYKFTSVYNYLTLLDDDNNNEDAVFLGTRRYLLKFVENFVYCDLSLVA